MAKKTAPKKTVKTAPTKVAPKAEATPAAVVERPPVLIRPAGTPQEPSPDAAEKQWWWEGGAEIPNDPDNVRFKARKAWYESQARAAEPPPVKGRPDQIAKDAADAAVNESRRAAQKEAGLK